MDPNWLVALIPLIVGAVFLVVGVHGIRRARHLRRTGAKAFGQVVRHDISHGENGTYYHPVVAWQTPDGHWRERVSPIGRSRKGRLTVGTQVVIHYDPADPGRAAIHGHDGAFAERLFAVLGTVLIAGAFVVVAVVLLT